MKKINKMYIVFIKMDNNYNDKYMDNCRDHIVPYNKLKDSNNMVLDNRNRMMNNRGIDNKDYNNFY